MGLGTGACFAVAGPAAGHVEVALCDACLAVIVVATAADCPGLVAVLDALDADCHAGLAIAPAVAPGLVLAKASSAACPGSLLVAPAAAAADCGLAADAC